jgi:excisionase family DNA binding protein
MSDDLLTPKEFAHQFRVSQRTVYTWLAEGRIPHHRIAGTIRIPASEVAKIVMKKTEHLADCAV